MKKPLGVVAPGHSNCETAVAAEIANLRLVGEREISPGLPLFAGGKCELWDFPHLGPLAALLEHSG